MTNNEIIINQAIAHGIYTKAEAQAIVAAKGCLPILNGECGAFNPLLLECLTDIQAELQEKPQNITVNR